MTRRPSLATAILAVVGAVGSLLMTLTSYTVGGIPGQHLSLAAARGRDRWVYELGLCLLIAAWLALGRLVLDRSVTGMTRRVCWAGTAMCAPLVASAPLTSQDVWAYLAQGNVAAHGLDPYAVGPSAVPGTYVGAVSHYWVHTPSQYGPLWTWISRLAVETTTPHLWAGMFVLRLVGLAAVVVTGVALARLCRVTGARVEVALWLTVANPFSALMLIGGLHNDSVMLALLVSGLAVAATGRSMWRAVLVGAVLVGLAGAVKAPALVVLPFLPLLWLRYADPSSESANEPPRHLAWVVPGAVAGGVGCVIVLLSGVVTGFGQGWVSRVGGVDSGVNWLSVPQVVASGLAHLLPGRVSTHDTERAGLVHDMGLGFLALSLVALTVTTARRTPLRTMAVAALLVVVTSPAPRAWYLLWPIVILAADRLPATLVVGVVTLSASVALWSPPAARPHLASVVLPLLLVGFALLTTGLVRATSRIASPA